METSGFFIEQVDWQTAQATGLHESGSHFVFLGFANFPEQLNWTAASQWVNCIDHRWPKPIKRTWCFIHSGVRK